MLSYDDEALARAMAHGTMTEVMCNGQALSQPGDGLDPRNGRRTPHSRRHGQADDAQV